jgi:oxaloacetate decarboxylase beta subunit
MQSIFVNLLKESGFYNFTFGQLIMICIGLLLGYLAIFKKSEPLLLLPIGFGCILANLPNAGFMNPPGGPLHPAGLFYVLYQYGVATEIFPLLIFMGVGAMTDFGPLIANPWTILLGAAAQFGVFIALIIAQLLRFSIGEAASIAIIGGADGPTAIYTSVKLAPHLLGAIAVAAYTYMSLVPIIQPPIMRLLTTKKERSVVMEQLRPFQGIRSCRKTFTYRCKRTHQYSDNFSGSHNRCHYECEGLSYSKNIGYHRLRSYSLFCQHSWRRITGKIVLSD